MTRLAYYPPDLKKIRHLATGQKPKKLSDEELMEQFESGDKQAFEELFKRYRRRIFHFILRFLRDKNASEDAVQDLFLKVVRNPSRFQARSRFSTWLHAVAKNLCIDLLRKKKRRYTYSLDTPRVYTDGNTGFSLQETFHDPSSSDMSTTDCLLRLKLLVAIRSIPDEQRVVFLLREVGGLPFSDIAAEVSIPLNTAKSRMRYALINLRRVLAELGIEKP